MRKEKKSKCFSMFLPLILFAIFLTSCSTAAFALGAKKDIVKERKNIVAKVNEQPIYEDALTPYVKRDLRKFQKYGAKRDTTALEKRLKRRALDEVIAQELIRQESRKLQIKDIKKKIDERIKAMKSKYPSEEHFKSFLEAKNLTENDLRASTRKSIYVDEYLEKKGIRNPEVPEEQIKKYYDFHKNNFQREESIKASQILIKVDENAKPEGKENAWAKADFGFVFRRSVQLSYGRIPCFFIPSFSINPYRSCWNECIAGKFL